MMGLDRNNADWQPNKYCGGGESPPAAAGPIKSHVVEIASPFHSKLKRGYGLHKMALSQRIT